MSPLGGQRRGGQCHSTETTNYFLQFSFKILTKISKSGKVFNGGMKSSGWKIAGHQPYRVPSLTQIIESGLIESIATRLSLRQINGL